MADVLPGITAVEAAPDAAVLAAGGHEIRPARGLPAVGVEDARVGRVHREVIDAGPVALEEDALPGLPAVGRAVETAVWVLAPDVAEGGRVDEVRVGGVDDDRADVLGLGQPHVAPGHTGVGGL